MFQYPSRLSSEPQPTSTVESKSVQIPSVTRQPLPQHPTSSQEETFEEHDLSQKVVKTPRSKTIRRQSPLPRLRFPRKKFSRIRVWLNDTFPHITMAMLWTKSTNSIVETPVASVGRICTFSSHPGSNACSVDSSSMQSACRRELVQNPVRISTQSLLEMGVEGVLRMRKWSVWSPLLFTRGVGGSTGSPARVRGIWESLGNSAWPELPSLRTERIKSYLVFENFNSCKSLLARR